MPLRTRLGASITLLPSSTLENSIIFARRPFLFFLPTSFMLIGCKLCEVGSLMILFTKFWSSLLDYTKLKITTLFCLFCCSCILLSIVSFMNVGTLGVQSSFSIFSISFINLGAVVLLLLNNPHSWLFVQTHYF